MQNASTHVLPVSKPFSLSVTCGPAHWVQHRSPRHAWINGAFVTVEVDAGKTVWREVQQTSDEEIEITTNTPIGTSEVWLRRVLSSDTALPSFADSFIQGLAHRYPGLRPLTDGSLFDGILTSIIGQSVSLASAAAAQYKLALAFNVSVALEGRDFMPLPSAEQLTDTSVELIRSSGVTWKRAEAIRFAARAEVNGELPSDEEARANREETRRALLALPLVGPWTAESALLWGVGAPDAYPTGDVALLRAARMVYDHPEMTMKELDALSENWRPARALAARLLWTELLGVAPDAAV